MIGDHYLNSYISPGISIHPDLSLDISCATLSRVRDYGYYFEYVSSEFSQEKTYSLWLYCSPKYSGNNRINVISGSRASNFPEYYGEIVHDIISPAKKELYYTYDATYGFYSPCWDNVFVELKSVRKFSTPELMTLWR